MTKSGFVAIVGRPNVGKSTLLNQILDKKISITSNKPQTTRHKISGIYTKDNKQVVFIDTPGMHKAKHLLNRRIDKLAVSTLKEVDLIIFVVDKELGSAEKHIISYFKDIKKDVYLVINKIDKINYKRGRIDNIILSYLNEYNFKSVYPISAIDNKHINHLMNDVLNSLNEGPFYYPKEMITDQSDKTMMAEFVREQILKFTEEEVPHAVAVVIENLKVNEEYKQLEVDVLIYVERDSQKRILIGKEGSKLKEIGTNARLNINERFEIKTHLNMWVKVKKNWRNNLTDLNNFGYGQDE